MLTLASLLHLSPQINDRMQILPRARLSLPRGGGNGGGSTANTELRPLIAGDAMAGVSSHIQNF